MTVAIAMRLSLCALCVLAGCAGDDTDRLLQDLSSEDVTTRRTAAQELAKRKPQRADVRAALEQSVSDSDKDVRRLACFALGEIGDANHAVLEKALADKQPSVRLAAAFALLKVGSQSKDATDVLKCAMKRGDGGVIIAVTNQGSRAAWAVPVLRQLLTDRRPGIRRLAAAGLGNIGPAARSALPALRNAGRDSDDRVREAAANAIALILKNRK